MESQQNHQAGECCKLPSLAPMTHFGAFPDTGRNTTGILLSAFQCLFVIDYFIKESTTSSRTECGGLEPNDSGLIKQPEESF